MTHLSVLSVDDCLRLLASHPTQLGRVAFMSDDGLTILPVNYRLSGGEILIHTEAGSLLLAAILREDVAFEVDDVNVAWKEGWSVLIRGKAREIDDPDEAAQRGELLRSWAERDSRMIAIRPGQITGRRIV